MRKGGIGIPSSEPPPARFIVAELSKTWSECQEDQRHVRELFEECIAFNLARGYRLHSWSYGTCAYNVHNLDGIVAVVQETIVAVFELERSTP